MAPFPSLEETLDALSGGGDWRAIREELLGLVGTGRRDEAHHRVAGIERTPVGVFAALGFDLEEAAGRRGARRILRRARQTGASAAPALPEGAWAPLAAWAHFRLWRHGRALASAQQAWARADTGGSAGGTGAALEPLVVRLWVEALDAITGLALRQGYLGHAQAAGRQSERFAALLAPMPDRSEAAATQSALRELVGKHCSHGVPPCLLRYLARSLGHPGKDSEAAAHEVSRDLSVTPAHLALARDLALRLGIAPAVTERLQEIEARTFRGHWRARRIVLRVAMMVFVALVAGLLVLGLTLVQHRLL